MTIKNIQVDIINKRLKNLEKKKLIIAKNKEECESEIVCLLQRYYPHDYKTIEEFAADYRKNTNGLSVKQIILTSTKAKDLLRKSFSGKLSVEVDPIKKNQFEEKRQKRIKSLEDRYKEKRVQKTDPLHFEKMIEMYENSSENNKLKLLIIDEFLKYDGIKVIGFLKKIVENKYIDHHLKVRINHHLHELNHSEQQLSPKPKGMGKNDKQKFANITYDPATEMMREVAERIKEKNPFELCKKYDVFISHCKEDFDYAWEEIIELNEQGETCYFCWRSDNKEGLVSDEEMKRILNLRISQARIFLIIDSDSWKNSFWCNFEKITAEQMGKTILSVKIDKTVS